MDSIFIKSYFWGPAHPSQLSSIMCVIISFTRILGVGSGIELTPGEVSASHFYVQKVGVGSGAVELSTSCHRSVAHLVGESVVRLTVSSNQ